MSVRSGGDPPVKFSPETKYFRVPMETVHVILVVSGPSVVPNPEFTPRNTTTGVFEFWRLAGPKETRSGNFYSLFHSPVVLQMAILANDFVSRLDFEDYRL